MTTYDDGFVEQIQADAARWKHEGQPQTSLYTGERLNKAKNWARENALTEDEWAFVIQSIETSYSEATSTFFRSLLFDVATLVTGVQGYLQLISQSGLDTLTDAQQSYLDRVDRLIRRMRWWRGDFVRFLNHEYTEEKLNVYLHPTHPGKLIDGVFATICELYPDYGAKLTKEVSGGLAPVNADGDQLQDTLIRLTAGIIPKVETLKLSAVKADDSVQFSIHVDGDYELAWIEKTLSGNGYPTDTVELNLLYLRSMLRVHGDDLSFTRENDLSGTLQFMLRTSEESK